MSDDRSRDPPESRLESARSVMLYDPSLAGNFAACWFDPDHWRQLDALRGVATGRGNTYFFESGSRQYALRHYRRGGLIARLASDRYLDLGADRSRPLREFRLTRRLRQLGLPVAAAVAARYAPEGLAYRGDLVTLRLADVQTLASRLAVDASALRDEWQRIGHVIARFHDAGVDHADLNAHNLLVDSHREWHLIDFDRARFRDPGLWCDANLVRLRRSLLKVCDAARIDFDEGSWHELLAGYREGRSRQPGKATP
jgi:3-deoxy-D-manno-octulosonic acid kinase